MRNDNLEFDFSMLEFEQSLQALTTLSKNVHGN